MQLTKLEIKGFKSFGDKITINFDEGVTAIVGPNGCGKSNVVDAIRWVMGEQSTKTLRSEKMENIIFNGTANRKPSNLAEVSLTFENNSNLLSTQFSTVTITRKLYRNGDSEYRLNDVKCRLKDITDLFLDTGLGADSYSIIELKMIDEIINNKDNSRRNLFEEASGISKYKVRKKQTLSKLKDTESDLSRVDDLLYEINKNLKQLETQAKKADKYFQLKEEYKEASIGLAYYRLENFSNDLIRINEQEKSQSSSIQANAAQIETSENQLRTLRIDILAKEKSLAVQQKSTQEYINKIRSYESDKKIKNEQVRHLQDKEARLTAELNNDKNQLQHVEHTIKRINEELFEEQGKLAVYQSDIDKHKAEVDELRQQQSSAKVKLDNFLAQSNELQNNIYKLEKDIAVLKIQLESLQQEALRTTTDTSSKEEELSQFNLVVNQLEERTQQQQDLFDLAQKAEENLQYQIQTVEETLNDTRIQLSRESRLVDAKQNEYNLTKSLVDNLEGFPESIKFLRKNAGWKKSYPLFSDILFCQEEYRVAIENYLEPIMNHYVVENQSEAVQAIQLLSDSSRGKANFFVLDAIQQVNTRPLPHVRTEAISALDIIKVDKKYEKLCEHLLKHVYLLKQSSADSMADILPTDELVLLHPDGKFSKNCLGISGGSVGLFEGKRIGRAKNLENLIKEIKSLNQKIEQLQIQEDDYVSKLASLRVASQKEIIDEQRNILNRLNNELISVKTKQEQYQEFIKNSQTRKLDIEGKITVLSFELQKAEPDLQILKVENDIHKKQLAEMQEAYSELADTLNDKSTIFNQENIRFHQQQNKVSSLEKDLEYRESQKENFESRIDKNSLEFEQVKLDMKDAVQFVDHNDEDLLAMYEQKEDLEKGLQEIEKDFYEFRKAIIDLEEEVTQLRRTKDQNDFLLSELKDKKTSLQIDLNALKERLSIEFNIDINELLAGEMPDIPMDQTELNASCDRLKKQLDSYGTINPMAKEAYDEMNQRHDFISKEKNDLMEAKTSLMATINEIDQTANEKFMFAFNTVRENFIQVFRSLFNEEDSCDMILTDPQNPLDSDIDIIARPKGKRPLSINQLSGGEKTLTATALLFSLYLLKPAPFCIFDEVDAPLDDTNIDKFNNIIRDFSAKSQFIIVSHNKRTIAATDIIYGVTMVEQGVSRVVPVDLRDVA
ncbi:chromosome segregation protein SMC [Sphingobacterium sp. UT-1RO-CII-1]|uniref:chromosome segregation protein SMC n=1 Tax=Sphingobacterium sp. UT-1RO-CII-1 TaxID=2995225 RepID=UPI00227AF2CA|nr:chromosome segregation protein SMC [Sphingobacterium sp. UT-1RO-CII-1]MCY4779707.1 chromosome segregation protein SMC [Sphingobacterium sp. UT-1RO-CII-1]